MAVITPYWTLDVVVVFLSALIGAYFYMTRHFNYWKKRGIIEMPPKPFVGNFGDCCLLKIAVSKYFQFLYERGEGLPYIGFYIFDKPALVLRDPEIIKGVLVKDFNYFMNRYATATESDVLGTANLFLLKNPVWKNLRYKLTPLFTSGKMKAMFPLLEAVGNDLTDHLESLNLEGEGRVIEWKEISAKFTTDVIGSCVFGLQVNSLNNPDAEFRKYGKMIFEVSFRRGFEFMSVFFIPRIAGPLRFVAFPAPCANFLRRVFWEIFNERLETGLRRGDLIDLLIDLKNSQIDNDDVDVFKFDGDYLVAQAGVFFAAGFETSSTAMSFALHELSMNPDVQEKLRHEVHTALEKNGGKLSYDMVQELPYLDKVVSETLRKYPSVPFLDREATKDYTIPKTGLVIEKGTPVYVSLLGLHHDPEYYPDPEKFDPERFSEENKRKRRPYVYMPFGDGPHNCIGLRFGVMQSKIGIIEVIKDYELRPCEKTLNPMRYDAKTILVVPAGGLYHRVRRIKAMVS